MKRCTSAIVIGFAAAALLGGCTQYRAMRMRNTDVTSDVDYAIGRGDRSFRGVVMGTERSVPGVPDDKAGRKLVEKYGVTIVNETNMATTAKDPAQADLADAALEYARQYNIALLRRYAGKLPDPAEPFLPERLPE